MWQLTPSGANPGRFAARAIELFGRRDIHAEFVLAQAGRDIWMSDGVHVGIHANGNRRRFARFDGRLARCIRFRLRFAVEAVNALLEGIRESRLRFSDSGENDRLRVRLPQREPGTAPRPRRYRTRRLPAPTETSTARFEFAFTAKQTRCGRPRSASRMRAKPSQNGRPE